MTNAQYRMLEMRNQLKRGPFKGNSQAEAEDFFRLKVTGDGETRWINISGKQLQQIALILGEES